MITAIIRNKENTLVLELPHSIYDIYEKLRSIGIMQPPKQIPLTDNEDEDIGVKLFSESDFGQHLLLTLNEKNTIADANMLTLVIGSASDNIKDELEQNILYDQYDTMDEVINAVREMTQDAGPVKAVFFCPLVGNIDEGDGDMFTVGDSYLADSADEIADALNRYTANDENDMAAYGKALIDFLASKYADEYSILQVGTGDSPLTVPFYEKCGFVRSHNIPNFFTDNYDHPIYESGVQLIDMVYLRRCL